MRPNPADDVLHFLTQPVWQTPIYWLLWATSVGIVARVWGHVPTRRGAREPVAWLLRVLVGTLWWLHSLAIVPPHESRLIAQLHAQAAYTAMAAQAALIHALLPNAAALGLVLYAIEAGIAVSLMLGLFTRLASLFGLALALAAWLGLYAAPGHQPWNDLLLVIVMTGYVADPPGRYLGIDAVLRRRLRGARVLRVLS